MITQNKNAQMENKSESEDMINKSAALTLAPYLASILCFAAGFSLIVAMLFKREFDSFSFALGMYFIGKAFFVGPLLYSSLKKKYE